MKIITSTEWVWDAGREEYVAFVVESEGYDGSIAEAKGRGGGGGGGGGGKGRVIGTALAIAVPFAAPAIAGSALAAGTVFANTAVTGAALGAAAGALTTGTLKGAVIGGITGGISGAISQGGFSIPSGNTVAGQAGATGISAGVEGATAATSNVGSSLAQTASAPLRTGVDPTMYGASFGQLGSGTAGMTMTPAGNIGVGLSTGVTDPLAVWGVTQPSLAQAGAAAGSMVPYSPVVGAAPYGAPVVQSVSPIASNYVAASNAVAAPTPGVWERFTKSVTDSLTPETLGKRMVDYAGMTLVGSLAETPDFGAGGAYDAGTLSALEKSGRLADLQAAQYGKNVPGLQDTGTSIAQTAANPMLMAGQSVNDFRLQSEGARRKLEEDLIRAGYQPGSAQYNQAMRQFGSRTDLGRVQAFNTGYGQGVSQGIGALSGAKSLHDQPGYGSLASAYSAAGLGSANIRQAEWNAQNQEAKALGNLFFPTNRDAELKRAQGMRTSSAFGGGN